MLTTLITILSTHLELPWRKDPERGDVPGWVLVTLMTAGLVIAIWTLAGPALGNVFQTAMNRVLAF